MELCGATDETHGQLFAAFFSDRWAIGAESDRPEPAKKNESPTAVVVASATAAAEETGRRGRRAVFDAHVSRLHRPLAQDRLQHPSADGQTLPAPDIRRHLHGSVQSRYTVISFLVSSEPQNATVRLPKVRQLDAKKYQCRLI